MKKILIGLILVLTSFSVYSQKTNLGNMVLRNEVKKQANEMGTDFLKGDYKAFAKYTHPKLVTLMGGEDRMITTLTKTINDVKKQGISFLNISFDNPTKIINVKNELQCTIKQHLVAKTPDGNVTNSSILIAVSLDNGWKWFFIDTTNKDVNQIKKIVPNLSKEIHF